MNDIRRQFRARLGLSLAVLFAALQVFQLFILPAWLLPLDAAWGWLLLVPVLLTNGWWAFIHEAIHGALFPGHWANRLAGRLHGVLFGAGFDLLRWGHLLHHAYSRTPRDRTEVYEDGRDNPALFTLVYYLRLLGGLYLFEVLWSLLMLAPRPLLSTLAGRLSGSGNPIAPLADKVLAMPTLVATRQDALAILALYGLSFLLYGQHAWMLWLALAGRGLLVSLMDNVFHYGTPLNDRCYALDLEAPAWVSALILHFNLHGAHHRHPALGWWELPLRHRDEGARPQGRLAPALVAQLRGPIPASRLERLRGQTNPPVRPEPAEG